MSEMRVKSEGPAELLLVGHNPAGAIVAALFAAALFWLAQGAAGAPGMLARGFTALLGLLCLAAALWRDSLRLDLVRRSWQRERGYWPIATRAEGPLGALRGFELKSERGRRRGKPTLEWEVWLRASDPPGDLRVCEAESESAARELAERLTRRLEASRS